jgi:cytoskeletal protein CcmA (bactofilin family)
MFKKESGLSNFNEAETIIGESVQVKGNFESNGNIVINGILNGEIKTKGSILVGEKAKISANITAEEISVHGQITVNLKIAGYLAIGSSAKIFGDVECSQISVEKGAEINGKVLLNNQKTNKKAEKVVEKNIEEENDDINE